MCSQQIKAAFCWIPSMPGYRCTRCPIVSLLVGIFTPAALWCWAQFLIFGCTLLLTWTVNHLNSSVQGCVQTCLLCGGALDKVRWTEGLSSWSAAVYFLTGVWLQIIGLWSWNSHYCLLKGDCSLLFWYSYLLIFALSLSLPPLLFLLWLLCQDTCTISPLIYT